MEEKMLDDLEFEQMIQGMDDRALKEFTARQTYIIAKRCTDHADRLAKLEARGSGAKMIAGIGAAVGGTVAGLVYGLIALVT